MTYVFIHYFFSSQSFIYLVTNCLKYPILSNKSDNFFCVKNYINLLSLFGMYRHKAAEAIIEMALIKADAEDGASRKALTPIDAPKCFDAQSNPRPVVLMRIDVCDKGI